MICLILFSNFSDALPALICLRGIANPWSICLGVNTLINLPFLSFNTIKDFFKNIDYFCRIFIFRNSFYVPGFYESTFVYSRFPPKIQFLSCLLIPLSLKLGIQFDGKCISNTFLTAEA